jgi:aspartate/methionine/tyrosine aminotransferase
MQQRHKRLVCVAALAPHWLRAHPCVTWPCARARCRRLTTGQGVEAFCEQLVADTGVLLLPSSVYDHPPSAAAGRFRLGLGRSNLPQCLQALRGWLIQQGHEPVKVAAP